MRFTGSDYVFVDDGHGGQFLEGTWELTILEGTGIYKPFAGGHNHMVDKLHFLAPGDGSNGVDEYCFCFISRPLATPNLRKTEAPDPSAQSRRERCLLGRKSSLRLSGALPW